MSQETQEGLKNVLTETELMELTGMNKSQVSRHRLSGDLTFVKASARHRLYFESDVMDFLRKKRITLNQAEETD